MDDLKLNKVDQVNSDNDDNSSSFVLDQYLDEIDQQENIQYQFKEPLSASQIYRKDFFNYFHTNYYGELENEGPFLASVRYIFFEEDDQLNVSSSSLEDTNDQRQQIIRAIIRAFHSAPCNDHFSGRIHYTSKDNYDISESSDVIDEENLLQRLIDKAHLPNIQHCKTVQYIKANEKIYQFDKGNDERQCYKIGIVYQSSNQSTESEILSNNKMSIEMENFLNLIGDRIELKGFKKYRGDLDTKCDFHGDYSYFRIYNNHQIMFNIAPIIPSDEKDQQFIQRKGLIANSFICIVYQEENSIFKPNIFHGKVTQVFITVQPTTINHLLYYKIRIWRRLHLRPIVDPGGGIYKHDQSFGNLFLRLIHNTMHIIYEERSIHSRIVQQKHRLKSEQLIRLFSIFDNTSFHSKNSSTYSDINPTSKSPNNLPLVKRHYSGFLPKLSEAFNRVKPIFNISASDPALPNFPDSQSSPTKFLSKYNSNTSHSKSSDEYSQSSSAEFYQRNSQQRRNLSSPLSTFASVSSDTNTIHLQELNINKLKSATSCNQEQSHNDST